MAGRQTNSLCILGRIQVMHLFGFWGNMSKVLPEAGGHTGPWSCTSLLENHDLCRCVCLCTCLFRVLPNTQSCSAHHAVISRPVCISSALSLLSYPCMETRANVNPLMLGLSNVSSHADGGELKSSTSHSLGEKKRRHTQVCSIHRCITAAFTHRRL